MSVSATESGLIAFFYCFIFLFGSILNGMVVLTCLRWRKTLLSQPKDVLIMSLAIGDFVTAFLVCPFGFSSAIAREWIWGRPGCIWYAFITLWVSGASILHVAIIAVERFITLQSSTPNIVSTRQILRAVLVCWSFTFLICFCPLIGWSKYTFEGLGLHCSIPWHIRSVNNITYCIFLLLVFFFVPLGIIVVCYINIFVIVRRLYQDADRMWGSESQATKSSYTAQVKTAKQLLYLVVGFLFAWTPYAVMSMSIIFFDANIPVGSQEFPSMFAKLAVIYNPIIYFFTYRELRNKAWKTITCAANRVSDSTSTGTNWQKIYTPRNLVR